MMGLLLFIFLMMIMGGMVIEFMDLRKEFCDWAKDKFCKKKEKSDKEE